MSSKKSRGSAPRKQEKSGSAKKKAGQPASPEGKSVPFLARPVLWLTAGGVLVLGCLVWFAVWIFTPLPVFVHGLSSRETTALQAAADTWGNARGIHAGIRVMSDGDLDSLPVRSDGGIAVFRLSAGIRKVSAHFTALPDSLLSGIAAPLRWNVEYPAGTPLAGKHWALPLMTDNLEFMFPLGLDSSAPGKAPSAARTEEIEALVSKYKPGMDSPLIFAGGDDSILLDLLGQILVSRSGPEAYQDLCLMTQAGKSLAEVLAADTSGSGLSSALGILLSWQSKTFLHKNWWDLSARDARSLLEADQGRLMIHTLGLRRDMDSNFLSGFQGLPFLVDLKAQNQVITAPSVCAALTGEGRWSKDAGDFLSWLAGAEGQRVLSQASGDAPAMLGVNAADIQARDARDWASSVRSVQGLSRDGFMDSATLKAFATDLRIWVKSKGN